MTMDENLLVWKKQNSDFIKRMQKNEINFEKKLEVSCVIIDFQV